MAFKGGNILRLSRKSESALLALVDLSRQYGKEPSKIMDVSKRNDIPKKYLEQIFRPKKVPGYVWSFRGAPDG